MDKSSIAYNASPYKKGDVIKENMETVLAESFPELKRTIELTWEPKWNTGFVTQAGRKALGLI